MESILKYARILNNILNTCWVFYTVFLMLSSKSILVYFSKKIVPYLYFKIHKIPFYFGLKAASRALTKYSCLVRLFSWIFILRFNVNAAFLRANERRRWSAGLIPDAVVGLRSSVSRRADGQRQALTGRVTLHVGNQLMCQHASQQSLLHTRTNHNARSTREDSMRRFYDTWDLRDTQRHEEFLGTWRRWMW